MAHTHTESSEWGACPHPTPLYQHPPNGQPWPVLSYPLPPPASSPYYPQPENGYAMVQYVPMPGYGVPLAGSADGYLHDRDDPPPVDVLPSPLHAKLKKTPQGGCGDFFPSKLYKMLEEAESSDHSGTVAWQPHGRGFVIKDRVRFMTQLVPLYFKATKYRTFQRQCGLWGFHRITSGPHIGTWWHESFVRGCPERLASIFRSPLKTKTSSIEHVPNFIIPSKALSRSVISNTGYLDSMSPTPIGAMKGTKDDGTILPLPILASEMKTWLSNVDFMDDEGSLMNDYTPLVSGGSQPGAG